MALNATPNMDVNTDISALITASDMAIIADPYGAGFDVLRATISGDHFNITTQQWLRFTDYAAGTKEGLTALGLYGLSGEDVYQATPSGLAVLRPVIEARARATNRVEVKAYIDASGAKALFAGYEYAPRNAENVAIHQCRAFGGLQSDAGDHAGRDCADRRLRADRCAKHPKIRRSGYG